ncbi:Tetratricopeptide repeat protein [compost metagenome]
MTIRVNNAAAATPAPKFNFAQAVKANAAETTRTATVGDNFKASTADDDQKLKDFIEANKGEYPELEEAGNNLKENLTSAAILFVLAGAVGAGSRELIMALKDKKNAFVEANAMSTDPIKRKLVAQDYLQRLSLGSVMRLAADPDLSVRYALAVRMKNNPDKFDKAVLEIMAEDPNPMIRGLVASSDKLSEKTVKRLANSETETSPQVRAAALSNKRLPKDEREFLVKLDAAKGGIYATMNRILSAPDSEANNRQKVGFLRSNPNIGLTRELMETLAKSTDAGVREALGRRPDLADDLIKQMYEHRSYTFMQKIKKMFGMDPGLPSGKATYEQNRVVLMTLANNPNASVSMLTHMVENAKKNGSANNFKSKIDAKIDERLGIPTTDKDPAQYNTDIVARAIVGNPRTDDTMRQLANAAAYPYRYDEATSMQAFLALNNANDLYLKGKYAESVDAYKKAIATTFHDSEQAYFELGQALMATNDVASARLAFMQALNINNGYTAAAVALDAINRPSGPR